MNPDKAFSNKLSGIGVINKGKVIKILEDGHKGTHHQRFIIRIPSGRSVLIAHNIEQAYQVKIKINDEVETKGNYVWSKYEGLLHNTHHANRGEHDDGYINFVGKKDPHRPTNLAQEKVSPKPRVRHAIWD